MRVGFAVSNTANEVRLDSRARKERLINARIIEARHGATIETRRTRRDDEIGTLQATIAHRRYFGDSRLKEHLSHHFSPRRI